MLAAWKRAATPGRCARIAIGRFDELRQRRFELRPLRRKGARLLHGQRAARRRCGDGHHRRLVDRHRRGQPLGCRRVAALLPPEVAGDHRDEDRDDRRHQPDVALARLDHLARVRDRAREFVFLQLVTFSTFHVARSRTRVIQTTLLAESDVLAALRLAANCPLAQGIPYAMSEG